MTPDDQRISEYENEGLALSLSESHGHDRSGDSTFIARPHQPPACCRGCRSHGRAAWPRSWRFLRGDPATDSMNIRPPSCEVLGTI